MEKLSVRKSIKLLERIIARLTMIGFAVMLMVLLSSSAKAQTVEYVDANLFKVTETSGNYYHVDSNGRYNGFFRLQQAYPNGDILVVHGNMYNGKRCGKVVYKLNNEIVAIRKYNKEGVLMQSTRIRPSNAILENSYLAEN